MLQRFQLLAMGHSVSNWRHQAQTAKISAEKQALRRELAEEHQTTASKQQELKLEEARINKAMHSTSQVTATAGGILTRFMLIHAI